MTLYAVRKRGNRWLVCAGDSDAIEFASYREALEAAFAAARVVPRGAGRFAGGERTDTAPRNGRSA